MIGALSYRPLADLLASLAVADARPVVAASTVLLCEQREQGHVCVHLAEFAGRAIGEGTMLVGATFPELAQWRDGLVRSGVCSAGDGTAPLVLDQKDRLYLRRHYRSERAIADWLRLRLQLPPLCTPAALRTALAALSLLPAPGAVDWQLAAVVAAALRPFTVLTGGPGTGKTTTVARILAVLQRLSPGLRVALCAPTGKAAARLAAAVAERGVEFGAPSGLAATTLHRLLHYIGDTDSFRAGPDRPLPYDCVVVDEASMLDPAVLAVLLSALPASARLLLVGDRDQLAAIGAGQVLGDLCRSAQPERGVGAALADSVAAATGMVLPARGDRTPLTDVVVTLRQNHRFGSQPGIGAFAAALAERNAAAAMAALRAGHGDLLLAADAEAALQSLQPLLLATVAAPSAAAALATLDRLRILCATRHGPQGVAAWNRRVEALLAAAGHRSSGPDYRGRPVLITANDHQNRLYNGDLGVVWPDGEGRSQLWLGTSSGALRSVSLLRLPAHETAWAMTVHKAQGSEFDTVLLVMPDRDGPLWAAPLLYTAVSRARRRALLLADNALLTAALARWPTRSSGLADAVAEAP